MSLSSSKYLIQAVLAAKLFLRCLVSFDTPLLLNGSSLIGPPVRLVFLIDWGLKPRSSTLPSRPDLSDRDGSPDILVFGVDEVKSNGRGGSISKSIRCWSVLTLRLKVGRGTGRDSISSRISSSSHVILILLPDALWMSEALAGKKSGVGSL